MKRFVFFGTLTALVLAGFLLLPPTFSAIGSPVVPDTAGRASELLPEELPPGVAPAPKKPKVKPVAGAPLDAIEQEIITLTNEARANAGLPALATGDSLRRVARLHARDMIERSFSESINPDGLTAEDRVMRDNRRAVAIVGENIGSGSSKDKELARRIVADWMGDPTARERILDRRYTQIGVGVVPSSSDVRAVQLFTRTIALTDPPVPQSIAAGSAMHVAVAGGDPSVRCDAVDVFSSATGLAVVGPVAFGEVPMSVAPGLYKLRFHCTGGSGARIYSGPQIEVTP